MLPAVVSSLVDALVSSSLATAWPQGPQKYSGRILSVWALGNGCMAGGKKKKKLVNREQNLPFFLFPSKSFTKLHLYFILYQQNLYYLVIRLSTLSSTTKTNQFQQIHCLKSCVAFVEMPCLLVIFFFSQPIAKVSLTAVVAFLGCLRVIY